MLFDPLQYAAFLPETYAISTMELSNTEKKRLRSLAHPLKPVLIISEKGVTSGVSKELERALEDHELIKVKLNIDEPDARKSLAVQLCQQHNCALVQLIGKVLIICRHAEKPNSKLSNLQRPS